MFSTIIYLITGAFGFLCTALIFGKNKNQKHSLINKYLILIVAVNAVRFLFHGISQAYPEIEIGELVNMLDISIGMLLPCYYLYFRNIVDETKFEVSNLFHFIVPFLIGTIYITIFFASPDKIELFSRLLFFTGLSFYLTYVTIVFVMLYKNVWYRKSEIKVIQKQNDLIKNWSIFLYFSFIVMILVRVIASIISNKPGIFNNNYFWLASLLWLGIYIKIFLTPEILYGYNFLNKTIDTAAEKVLLSSVWLIGGMVSHISNEKDKKIEEKIKPLLLDYLHQIEELSFYTQTFRNPDLSLDDIAVALNIPNSHINFIFKYHCNESITDFKKIVRIHDSIKLLESGYLNNHKVESLAETVGFSSYNTFNRAFKSITGVTTQDYIKRL